MTSVSKQKTYLFIGTYTSGESEGIYVYSLDQETGELSYVSTLSGIENPSYLTVDHAGEYLYAVNEVSQFMGENSGGVTAAKIDKATGQVSMINSQLSLGTSPCYIDIDKKSSYVYVSNYSSGTVSVLPIEENGGLGAATEVIQHVGHSINKNRQEGPHAHSISLDPNNKYALACDLGIDKVMVYDVTEKEGKLVEGSFPWAEVKPGAGPRHLAFHPSGIYAYVINELDSTISSFSYHQEEGRLDAIETVSTLPEGYEGNNSCADIHIHPNGRYLYGSNRGDNSIVIFKINQQTGELSYVDHHSTMGKTPRNFVIDPTGKFLLAANQDSDSIYSFHIDSSTGKLSPTNHHIHVPAPVCLKLRTYSS